MAAIRFAFWNLQNFFDTDDDPISRDFDFTPAEGWTQEVFEAKKANLATALNATHGGAGPELLAVAEIEKDGLLEELAISMGNPHLRVVEDPGGTSDLRGIDVAMAFDERVLEVVERRSHLVHLRYRTRDLFEVVFRVLATGETFAVIACHWPSRVLGRYHSEPLRIAVAEHVAYLVEDHVKFEPDAYEALRTANDLAEVQRRWEAKVLVVGDLNDEPSDRSLVEHLRASNDLDRVTGETNDIDRFETQTSRYRGKDVFLYNASWKFMHQQHVGTHFLDGTRSGRLANRYQVLDQLIASRGLVSGHGLTLDIDSVEIFRDPIVATASGRPRGFRKSTKKGTSDHLPITARLSF